MPHPTLPPGATGALPPVATGTLAPEAPLPSLVPAMARVLHNIRRAGRPSLHALGVDRARQAYELGAEMLDLPRAPLPRVENLNVPGGDGAPRRARLYAPTADRLPVLLYLHGGGFVIGSLETHDSLCRQLALRSGAAVLAVDYRLAPEHRFPAAVDDALAALRWLRDRAAAFGLDPSRLAVGGDSAGGTLAAVLALQARDLGIELRLQVLITPGTAARSDSPSHRRFARGYLLEADSIAWFFDQAIDAAHRTDWRFAPLEAETLRGVAPACVVLAECDPLVDEGQAYADRLRKSGVPVTLAVAAGVTHDFIKMGRVLKEAAAVQTAIGRALAAAFGLEPTDASFPDASFP